jgi:hypothetical protein
MNGYEILQLGMSILLLGFILGYAFYIMSYIFGGRSKIDERLRRYAGTTEH